MMEVAEYRSLRSFRQESKLFEYLISKKSDLIKKECLRYRLSTIRLALEIIIDREELFDDYNREIVVCGNELERVLDRRSFHYSQTVSLIETHLLEAKDTDPLTSPRLCQAEIDRISCFYKYRLTFPEAILNNFDVSATYYVCPLLMRLIRPFGDFGRSFIHPYAKVVFAVSKYILSKKHHFFDLRNITIAHVKDDPLSRVFDVTHFTNLQIRYLIRAQLRLVRKSKRLKPPNPCRFCNH